MPIRIWHHKDASLYRIELPSRQKTTPKEWKFDHVNCFIDEKWTLYGNVMYVFQISSFPPIPRGCQLYTLDHNTEYPYNTIDIYKSGYIDKNKGT
jgi:hypothetical protein